MGRYVDYTKKESLNNEFLINHVTDTYCIDNEVVLEYIRLYQEIPYVSLSDGYLISDDLVEERLKTIQRIFKLKKINKNK